MKLQVKFWRRFAEAVVDETIGQGQPSPPPTPKPQIAPPHRAVEQSLRERLGPEKKGRK